MLKPSSEIPAVKFRAQSSELLNLVIEKHILVTITKYGIPVAKLVPIENKASQDFFGCMKGTAIEKEDVLGPIEEQWDADK